MELISFLLLRHLRVLTIASCIAALLISGPAKAQPLPCGTPAAMTSTCAAACVVCDINGFTGRNNSSVQGQAPPGFCTTQVHHMQWIAFIAGSTNLTLRVDVFNCAQGQGLEIGIYQTSNCQTFSLVSNCNTDVPNNNSGIFTNTVPLVIGQHYYFVMDGSANDICNYTVTVISGSTLVPPLSGSGEIVGPSSVCPGSSATFSTPGVTGAVAYQWTLNGNSVGSGNTLDYNFPSAAGNYQLCLTASNACSTPPPTCRNITVPATPSTTLFGEICPGACITLADTTICVPGSYLRGFTASNGCDSLVFLQVEAAPDVETILDLFICEGDTLAVGGTPYFATGQYQEVLTAANGCDSIIRLDLLVVICEIEAQITANAVSCKGDSDGVLQFGVVNGTPPFTYSWRRIGPGFPGGQGTLDNIGIRDTLTGLPPGQYIIIIQDLFGNDVVLLEEITEPLILQVTADAPEYNGFEISCFGGQNGSLQAIPAGGNAPYRFIWSNGADQSRVESLSAGTYTVTVTDATDCRASSSITLSSPSPIVAEVAFTDPGCDGPLTGSITATSVSGGVAPYVFTLGGGDFSGQASFGGIGQGIYTLRIRDTNGCEQSISGTLTSAAIPEIELGPDLTLELGEQIRLNAVVNMPLTGVSWSPAGSLSCADCPAPYASPVANTTYTFRGLSQDGCPGLDSVTVTVLLVRDVFVPNAFSPDGNGVNDRLVVFGGPEVLQIRRFRVFSRWGELVYERREFKANEEGVGWDGKFRGKALGQGVFAWVADIEFIDGITITYEGEVTLLR